MMIRRMEWNVKAHLIGPGRSKEKRIGECPRGHSPSLGREALTGRVSNNDERVIV
jgi:hypothetical protein